MSKEENKDLLESINDWWGYNITSTYVFYSILAEYELKKEIEKRFNVNVDIKGSNGFYEHRIIRL